MNYTMNQRAIMAEQVQMMYRIDETKLHEITNSKLRRQLKRMEEERR